MKTLSLDIEYDRSAESIAKISNVDLSINYLENAVSAKFQNLQGQKMRTWGRLQRKLDVVAEKKLKEVELEEGEVDFLKEAVKDAPVLPSLSKYVVRLIDAVEKL